MSNQDSICGQKGLARTQTNESSPLSRRQLIGGAIAGMSAIGMVEARAEGTKPTRSAKSQRPVINGTGIPTEAIVARHRAGESFLELAEDYGLKPELVEDAVRYEMRPAA